MFSEVIMGARLRLIVTCRTHRTEKHASPDLGKHTYYFDGGGIPRGSRQPSRPTDSGRNAGVGLWRAPSAPACSRGAYVRPESFEGESGEGGVLGGTGAGPWDLVRRKLGAPASQGTGPGIFPFGGEGYFHYS